MHLLKVFDFLNQNIYCENLKVVTFFSLHLCSFTGRSTRGHGIFYQQYLSFNLREGLEHNIPDGVEHALLKFKKQERSLIKLTPALPV